MTHFKYVHILLFEICSFSWVLRSAYMKALTISDFHLAIIVTWSIHSFIFVYCVLSPLFWRRETKRICHHKYTNVHKKNNCTSSFSVLWQQATSVQVLYHHLLWHRGNGKKNKWFMRWCIINKISIFHFKYHGYRQYPCITTHLA